MEKSGSLEQPDVDDRYAPDPAERYAPRASTPAEDSQILASSPEAVQLPGSFRKSAELQPSSLSPTPGIIRRSGTPSPSPAKASQSCGVHTA